MSLTTRMKALIHDVEKTERQSQERAESERRVRALVVEWRVHADMAHTPFACAALWRAAADELEHRINGTDPYAGDFSRGNLDLEALAEGRMDCRDTGGDS